MKRLCFGITVMILTSLAGCTAANRNGNSGTGESLSQQVYRHEQELRAIKSQIGQVEQILPGQAEVWSQVQTMRQELNSVHGQIDNMQRSGVGDASQLQERITRLEMLMRRLGAQTGVDTSLLDAPLTDGVNQSFSGQESNPALTTEPGPQLSTGPAGGATTPGPGPETAEGSKDTVTAMYESGMTAFGQGRYADALKIFQDLSASSPQHKLASNALFWEGESYFKMNNYANAAMAYQEVIEKHPGSPKYQAALLKQGMALYHAGKKDAAKERLNGLISRYPTSQEASSAKAFMKNNP